ncbi:MAG: glycoside hydrolase family 31 protein [Saprospiraceae bacterium]|nr:glycoside hydrolase family 31 protein [Saprospiraceae bacterium]
MTHNEFYPGKFSEIQRLNNEFVVLTDNQCAIKISVLSDHIIRIRYSTDGHFEHDFSYAISNKFVPITENVEQKIHLDHIEIITNAVILHINKLDSKLTFTDIAGKIICRDERGFHWEEHRQYGGNVVKMSKVVKEGEHFYGMGDKTMHLNLRGRRVTNWAMDTYGFKKEEDPIYKAIPFYTAIHSEIGYGIFFDNTFKAHFDFGSERRSVTSFWAEGGEMNYYFIFGPELIDVTRRYTQLTGTPELPPLWSLGYQQSKWSYYPHTKVKEVTNKLRSNLIPCDAIYLDIDYMDGFRCFTWDKEKFPEPKAMISELKKNGFKTVVIIDPGIKIDENYAVYNEAIENNYFCRRADGPFMKGKVWPGDCYFPDFTNPKVRKWWSGLFQELIEEIGVRGVWNDMNEPALFEINGKTFPDDVRHDFDGNPCSHRKAHNVYGMQMARATFKGVKKYNSGQRPLVITRSAYSGAQRYASAWTGDNIASWEHLWIATMQCQRMSTSGFSFVGSDIGGFIDHPTPELFVRWMQLAVFHPFFRTHSSGDHGEQEPWSFGEAALKIIRTYIELRYTLLPYIYTAFHQYVNEFTPMLKPISMFDQSDQDTLYRVDEFLMGDHILVCPVLEPNAKSRYVYLPKGKWYNYWTNKVFEGGKEILAEAPLEQIPLYIREGAVIPFYPVMQYVGEKQVDQLTIKVYYGGESLNSYLYEDSGDGYDYEKGIYNRKKFKTQSTPTSFKMSLKTNGHYEPSYSTYKVVLFGLPFLPSRILVNDKEMDINSKYIENQSLVFTTERLSFISLEVFK